METQPIEIPALGRHFKLGMLYDKRRDLMIPGVTLWDKASLEKNTYVRPQPGTQYDIETEDSYDKKIKLLDITGSMKLSCLGGLVSCEGSAKYLDDRTSSNNVSRVTMKYNVTTKYKELTMEHLEKSKIQHKYIIKEKVATHVVTGIYYGANAYFVFDREVSKTEDRNEITGSLKGLIEKIPKCSIGGTFQYESKDEDWKNVDKMQVKFYGDFNLKENPTTFKDAVSVYQTLPSLLGEDGELAIPIRVSLYPLKNLNSKAASVKFDISAGLVNQTSEIFESLHKMKLNCNQIKNSYPCEYFQAIKGNISELLGQLSQYETKLKGKLLPILPEIRDGKIKEKELAAVIDRHLSSPFSCQKIEYLFEHYQNELNIFEAYLTMLHRKDNVDVLLGIGQLESSLIRNDEVACLEIHYNTQQDPGMAVRNQYLLNPLKLLSMPKTGDPWYRDSKRKEDMRDTVHQFASYIQANKGTNIKCIAAVTENRDNPTQVSIKLYAKGKKIQEKFIPPSAPMHFRVTGAQQGTVSLEWDRPLIGLHFIREFKVMFKRISHGDDGADKDDIVDKRNWDHVKIPMGKYACSIKDLDPAVPYSFVVCGMCDFGQTENSEVVEAEAKAGIKYSKLKKRSYSVDFEHEMGHVEHMKSIIDQLKLTNKYAERKLSTMDILVMGKHVKERQPSSEGDIPAYFLQRLLSFDVKCRHIDSSPKAPASQCQNLSLGRTLTVEQLLQAGQTDENKESSSIHPSDIMIAIFHCADDRLRQLMSSQLAECHFSIPLLVPQEPSDPSNSDVVFPLISFRDIQKSWKTRCPPQLFKNKPLIKVKSPLIAFFHIGHDPSISKSQIMNEIISSNKVETFLNWHGEVTTANRRLLEGVAEIAWFLPGGSEDDPFDEMLAFVNLHGDARFHQKQVNLLMNNSSAPVVFYSDNGLDDVGRELLQKMLNQKRPMMCIDTNGEPGLTKYGGYDQYKLGIRKKKISDIKGEVIRVLPKLFKKQRRVSLLDLSADAKISNIKVDEELNEYLEAKKLPDKILLSLMQNNAEQSKRECFILQGQANQDIFKTKTPPSISDQERQSLIIKAKQKCEKAFLEKKPMALFIEALLTKNKTTVHYLKQLLDERSNEELSALREARDRQWDKVSELQSYKTRSPLLKKEEEQLKILDKQLIESSFGLEHFLREMYLLYELVVCKPESPDLFNIKEKLICLPSIIADLVISGQPFELMDGNADYVPVYWIRCVLQDVVAKLSPHSRVLPLTALGIQNSGKSTMLKALFGIQFAVTGGRCTRGVFMQLIRIDEDMREQLQYDYIIILDVEGLKAAEMIHSGKVHDETKLATFPTGLAEVVLVNMFGENPADKRETIELVVKGLLKVESIGMKPTCIFVHQNIPDASKIAGTIRRQLLDDLNSITHQQSDGKHKKFSEITSFDANKDIHYISTLWQGNSPMANPNPGYSADILNLKKTLLDIPLRRTDRPILNLQGFIRCVEKICELL